MNKLTTLLVGTGLAGAAILGAVAPATAAPTTPNTTASTQAAGDRVEGVVSFNYAGIDFSSISREWPDGSLADKVYTVLQDGQGGTPAAWELPEAGTVGPIHPVGTYADSCLTYAGSRLSWEDCNGTGNQNFILQAYTVPGGVNGYVISPDADRSRALVRGGHTAYGYHDMSTVTDMRYALVIDNYSSLTPVGAVSTPVDVTGPAAGESVADETPVFSGTGEPGAAIVVKDAAGNELGKTTVGADGSWSVESGVALTDGPITVTVEQTDAAGDVTSDTVDFIVAAGPSIPVIAPVVALGALGLAGAGALVGARRRKTARA